MHTQTTENTRPDAPAAPPMTNREMAAILFNIASCLREAGNQNPWRTAAYERGARALMGLRPQARDVLADADRVPFRQWQHIGTRLHAKIGEMVRTGALDQYAALLADLPPHRAALMTVPGIGPKTADVLFDTLGVATVAGLVAAARDGSLGRVRGFGARRIRDIAALPVATPGMLTLFEGVE